MRGGTGRERAMPHAGNRRPVADGRSLQTLDEVPDIVHPVDLFGNLLGALGGGERAAAGNIGRGLPPLAGEETGQNGAARPASSGNREALLGLQKLVVAVADGHLGDVGHLRDGGLGRLLVCEKRGGVDGRRGQSHG